MALTHFRRPGRARTVALTGAVTMLAVGAVAAPAAADSLPSQVLATATDLSEFGAATEVALTDENLFVEVATASGQQVVWRPRTGGDWSTTWGGTSLTGELVAAESDVVQVRDGDVDTVAWGRGGGGSRTVPAGAELGHGAQYVAWVSQGQALVQPVDADTTVLTVPAPGDSRSQGVVVTGDDVLTLADHVVRRYDVPTGAVVDERTVCGGGYATSRLPDADERFTVVWCSDNTLHVWDLAGVYRDIETREPVSARTPAQLGQGVLVAESYHDAGLVGLPLLESRGYALGLQGDFSSTGAPLSDVDDAGNGVAFVDSSGDVRLVDLTGIASTVASEPLDTAPPSASVPTIDAAANVGGVPTGEHRVSASGTDDGTSPFVPSGLASVELRYRQQLVHEDELGDYVSVPAATIETTAPRGSTTCWSARATDKAGNTGAWTAEACITVERA